MFIFSILIQFIFALAELVQDKLILRCCCFFIRSSFISTSLQVKTADSSKELEKNIGIYFWLQFNQFQYFQSNCFSSTRLAFDKMATALAIENLSSGDNSDDGSDTLDCRTYFRSYKENEKYYSDCLVENCHKRRLAGKQKFNLERHLSTVHNMKFVHHVPELPRNEITLKIKMDPWCTKHTWRT